MQRERKYIPFTVINNTKCIKHYITSRLVKLVFVKERLLIFCVIIATWSVTGLLWMSTKLDDFLNVNKGFKKKNLKDEKEELGKIFKLQLCE